MDLNSIPFAAIERVEVLRDGASAVYGTDAIGG
ncbi:TonB-dependent receptor plug domain-containing protein [Stenotrophomonas pictorum]